MDVCCLKQRQGVHTKGLQTCLQPAERREKEGILLLAKKDRQTGDREQVSRDLNRDT